MTEVLERAAALDSRLAALEASLIARRDSEGRATPLMMKDPGSVDFHGGHNGKSPGGPDAANATPW